MACRKCGSGWATIHGADRASCPECCKLARCVERKAGRYTDPTEVKKCAECGGEFTATGIKEIAEKACCSAECQKARRVRANRAHRKRYASEEYKAANRDTVPAATKRERPRCAMCGKECTSRSSKKYCSPKCFVDARNAGVQTWDRSAIEEAARKRPNNVSQSPWRYFHKQCDASMRGFLYEASSLWKRAVIPKDCVVCGRLFCRSGKCCSRRCASKVVLASDCIDCGISVSHAWRVKIPRCPKCIKRRENKKNREGANNRKRCRRYSVPYDSTLKPKVIFLRDGYKCYLCGRQTRPDKSPRHPRYPTVDHVVPLSAGIYGHVDHNVRCACSECNTRKGVEWDKQLRLAPL
jgi:hypothetical protein